MLRHTIILLFDSKIQNKNLVSLSENKIFRNESSQKKFKLRINANKTYYIMVLIIKLEK